jgi:hypothetical protein
MASTVLSNLPSEARLRFSRSLTAGNLSCLTTNNPISHKLVLAPPPESREGEPLALTLAVARYSRTETDARKKDSVIFVLISRTNFSRNFVRVLCATVRDFSAVTMQLNPGKGLKTNKRDSGI